MCLTGLIASYSNSIIDGNAWIVTPVVVFSILLGLILFFIYRQPDSGKKLAFSVRLSHPDVNISVKIYENRSENFNFYDNI